MKFFIRIIFIVCSINVYNCNAKNTPPQKNSIKNIIWDAGSTLTLVNRWDIAKEMGARGVASMILRIGKPENIRKTIFKVLEDYAGKQKPPLPEDLLSCDDNNVPLPQLMSDTWLCSRISNEQLIEHVDTAVKAWAKKENKSKKQQAIVKKILVTALSAEILGEHTRCATEALELVKICAQKGYRQFILSNFEKEAFDIAYKNDHNQELFCYIPREHIVISGECGMIKPYKCIYTYFLERYNLDPRECLLIDDRPENIQAALACGMYGLYLKPGKYRKLRQKLEKWNII